MTSVVDHSLRHSDTALGKSNRRWYLLGTTGLVMMVLAVVGFVWLRAYVLREQVEVVTPVETEFFSGQQ